MPIGCRQFVKLSNGWSPARQIYALRYKSSAIVLLFFAAVENRQKQTFVTFAPCARDESKSDAYDGLPQCC